MNALQNDYFIATGYAESNKISASEQGKEFELDFFPELGFSGY